MNLMSINIASLTGLNRMLSVNTEAPRPQVKRFYTAGNIT